MPSKNPRISVVLSPSLAATLAALSEATGDSASSLVRGLLEQTEHHVDQVAVKAGFFNYERMRRTFSRRMGVSPAAYRALLVGSAIRRSHLEEDDRVQDPYCLRCQPQVMGACLDLLHDAADFLATEANGVSDNPLIFSERGEALSGGNFHAEPVAFAADMMAMAICEIASIAERRIAMLIDPVLSGLPAFLTPRPGLNSGFMIPQVTAAALVSENKQRAYPASVDSIPTSANQEDHVSMAAHGARRLLPMLVETASLSGAILLIIGAATAMAWSLTQSGFSQDLTDAMAALPGGPVGFIAVSIVVFIILGSVLEGIPAIVLFGPLLFPIAREVGVHEVHYAMIVILAMGIGLFTPPFGVGYYAACAIGRANPNEGIRPIIGYMLALAVGLIVVAAVPWISIGFLD